MMRLPVMLQLLMLRRMTLTRHAASAIMFAPPVLGLRCQALMLKRGGAMQGEGKEAGGKGRASKRKANRAIRNEEAQESDEEYDWEADHEDCDWAAHPAECIIAVTNKQKYEVSCCQALCGPATSSAGLKPVHSANLYSWFLKSENMGMVASRALKLTPWRVYR